MIDTYVYFSSFGNLKKLYVYLWEEHSKETKMVTPWVEEKKFIPGFQGCLSSKAERSKWGVQCLIRIMGICGKRKLVSWRGEVGGFEIYNKYI